MLNKKVRIIAVDFDCTLTLDDNNYPECGRPNVEAIKLMKEFRRQGGKLILWTCRYGEGLEKAVAMCSAYGLKFDAVNDNLPEQSAKWRSSHPDAVVMSRKIYADMYLDDKDVRALMRGGVDWNGVSMVLFGQTLSEFLKFHGYVAEELEEAI